ncbi:MAG TPA: ATP-binding protein [Thermoanaerobaculia bacterium]|nr:ATP-binding protein [Thermoanaerobaculia bacterium]
MDDAASLSLPSDRPSPGSPQESEPLLRAVFESAVDAILIAGDDGRYVSANPAAGVLFGLPPEDLIGRSIVDFLEPGLDFPAAWNAFLDRGRESGEMELRRLDGRRVHVEYNAAAHVIPGRHLSILRDISDRKLTEEALHHSNTARTQAQEGLRLLAEAGQILSESLDFQTTLQNVARLVVPVFADWCVLDIVAENGTMERLITVHGNPGRQTLVEELKRFPPRWESQVGPPEVLRSGQPLFIREMAPGQTATFSQNAEHLRILTELDPFSAITVPILARGRRLGIWAFVRSHGSPRYEERDLRLAETLARRAGLALDNARLYNELESANRAKDQFLASLSHELRTPLTPVLMLVSKLERRDGNGEELRRDLAVIRKNIELEARLIDDLLDLTRITRGKVELQREAVDVHALLAHTLEMCCGQSLENCPLHIETDFQAPDARVWADGPRLTQVFWNLLSNAVKFTPPGGRVRVRTWSTAPPEPPLEPPLEQKPAGPAGEGMGELVVEISDTGIGIEPDLLPRLFSAFEQGDGSTARRFGGLGLGLAISRAVLELHGGHLTALSQGRDQGATFTAHLPVHREHFAALPALASSPSLPLERDRGSRSEEPGREEAKPGGGGLRILLIEDHPDTADALADLLGTKGHAVTVAGSVASALAAARRLMETAGPGLDLVLSDLGLPDGTGYDVMRDLSHRYGLTGVALSGYGMEDDIRRSHESGFCLHLTKPVTLQTLEEAIRKCRTGAGQPTGRVPVG